MADHPNFAVDPYITKEELQELGAPINTFLMRMPLF